MKRGNWIKGFFENGKPQSMSDGIAFILVFAGVVYAFIYQDAGSGIAIAGPGIALKGHKNFEATRRLQPKIDNNDEESKEDNAS